MVVLITDGIHSHRLTATAIAPGFPPLRDYLRARERPLLEIRQVGTSLLRDCWYESTLRLEASSS